MSIPVPIDALAARMEEYGTTAFFLTSGAQEARPHVSHVALTWEGDELVVGIGRSGARNLAAAPTAVLLWPPVEPGGYSMIVDVVARVDGEVARLRPERGVLHRPAPAPDASADASCGHDCAPL